MRTFAVVSVFAIVASLPVSAQPVAVFDTVFYSDADGQRIATMYIPESSISNGVGVALGHFWKGTRQALRCWAESLAAHGYTAMAFDYYDFDYLTTICKYPKPVTTFKLAVEFLRRGAKRLNISSGKVVGFGYSEGSIHWGQSIIWDNDDAFFGTDPAIDDHLDAAVLFYGAYDTENHQLTGVFHLDTVFDPFFSLDSVLRHTKGNTIANVSLITTPVILFHGTQDKSIHYMQSVAFHESLKANGKLSELHLNEFGHMFDAYRNGYGERVFTSVGLETKDTVLAFLQKYVLTPVSVPHASGFPNTFVLAQNYPNPFNPSTTMKYELPQAAMVTLSIFDMLGREVSVLVNERKDVGVHEVRFEARDLPTGVYVYRLRAGGFVQSKKLILLK